jgi:hypothetical protein
MFHRFRYAIVTLARGSTASHLFPISASQNATNARTRARAQNDPRSRSTCHVPVPSGGHRSQQRHDLRRGAIRDVCSRLIGLQISRHGEGTNFGQRPQHQTRPCAGLHALNFRCSPIVFSNSGFRCQALREILAGPTVLSAVRACPPHDGVRRRWWINVASAVSQIESSQKIGRSHHRHRPGRDIFSRRTAGTPWSRYCSLRGNLLLRPVELGSVDPHAVQNDRQLARDGDCGLSEPIALGEPHAPSL